ncbi:hypothetical protein N5C48_01860 [Enterobacter hormaechei]|nr:hypothetical protein [Enterobacter hormaechei]MDH0802199.1 hypothetical protein [Enterobacter hormaechei]
MKKRFSDEQIISILREAEAGVTEHNQIWQSVMSEERKFATPTTT